MSKRTIMRITCEPVEGKGWVTHADGPTVAGYSAAGKTWLEAWRNILHLLDKHPPDLPADLL